MDFLHEEDTIEVKIGDLFEVRALYFPVDEETANLSRIICPDPSLRYVRKVVRGGKYGCRAEPKREYTLYATCPGEFKIHLYFTEDLGEMSKYVPPEDLFSEDILEKTITVIATRRDNK